MERKEQKREVRRSCRYFVYCFDFDYVYVGGRVMKEARMGMKVRIIKYEEIQPWQRKYLGKVGIVVDNDVNVPDVKFEDGRIIAFEISKLEEVKDFTKADLKDGMLIEYRNPKDESNKKRVVIGDYIFVVNGFGCMHIKRFKKDLTRTENSDYDIMKVYDRGELVWEREEVIQVGFDEMENGCLYTSVYTSQKYKIVSNTLMFLNKETGWSPSCLNNDAELKKLRFVKVVE